MVSYSSLDSLSKKKVTLCHPDGPSYTHTHTHNQAGTLNRTRKNEHVIEVACLKGKEAVFGDISRPQLISERGTM